MLQRNIVSVGELTSKQLVCLTAVSNVVGWCEYVYTSLVKGNKECVPFRQWIKVASRYYIDVLNEAPLQGTLSPPDDLAQKEIYQDLVAQTSIKLLVKEEEVRNVFAIGRLRRYPILGIGAILDRIPPSIADKLIAGWGKKEFISLSLRYHVPLLTEGLFLSMPREMYKMLIESSELPFVEGYGSPLNNNSQGEFREYCSLFSQDSKYGALQRFDELVPRLNFPVRLCINPPYTPRAIERCVEITLSYMERVRGEFIMLLPVLHGYDLTAPIREYRNTCYCLLKEGDYTLYSFFTGRSICSPMSLYLIVNVRNSKQKSEALLASARRLLYQEAKKVESTHITRRSL